MEIKMENFRFGIMGAGEIAVKFCDAVRRLENCEVAAVSSKSMEKAEKFAQSSNVPKAYGSYREMLENEKLDCVYIAVLPNAHFELCMLCLDYHMPVLCEKAMFMDSSEAAAVFERSEKQNVFVMEALWSRFLPAVRKGKQWLEEGRIGRIRLSDATIGFLAPYGDENRYHNPALGAGAAHDIMVYAYEITTYMFPQEIVDTRAVALWEATGTDLTDHAVLRFADMTATMTASLGAALDERIIIYGEDGRIVIPHPHYGDEAFLCDREGRVTEHFRDEETENGFTYEIQEVMDCIRAGKTESEVVSHKCTLECSELYDKIAMSKI